MIMGGDYCIDIFIVYLSYILSSKSKVNLLQIENYKKETDQLLIRCLYIYFESGFDYRYYF